MMLPGGARMKSVRLQLLVTLATTLIAAGLFVHRGPPPSKSLRDAVFEDDLTQAERSVRWGASVAVHDGEWRTLLHVPGHKANPDMVALLIRAGADPDARDAKGWTPLHWAVEYNEVDFRPSVQVVAALIAGGADVNARDAEGRTPIMVCACNYDRVLARMLLEHGADVKIASKNLHFGIHFFGLSSSFHKPRRPAPPPDTDDGWTPLHEAVFHGDEQMTELLLEHRADVNARDWRGRTPLGVAVEEECDDMADFLRRHGAKE